MGTRFVSKSAALLATAMAISSMSNVMALAKQVQFMSLSTEIDGVPESYVDFCQSLKNFNFDAFDYLPYDKLGIPTMADLEKLKHKWVSDLKKKLGIQHANLLLQYCQARRVKSPGGDLLYPNAVLEREPADTRDLMKHLSEHSIKEKKKAAAKAAVDKLLNEEIQSAEKEGAKDGRRMLDFLLPQVSDDGLVALADSDNDTP